jgi:hypothetical protein
MPTLIFQKASRLNVAGIGHAIKINSNFGAYANTVVSFPINQWKNTKSWTYDAIYGTGAGRADALANIGGVLASGYIYAVMSQNIRAGMKYGWNVLTDNPTTEQEEKLAQLLDYKYHLTQMGLQFGQLPLAEKSLWVRPVASMLGDVLNYAVSNIDSSKGETKKEWEDVAKNVNGFLGELMFARPSGLLEKPHYGYVNKLDDANRLASTISPYLGLITDLSFSMLKTIQLSEGNTKKEQLENDIILEKAFVSVMTVLNLLPFQKDVDVLLKQDLRNKKQESWNIKKDKEEEKPNGYQKSTGGYKKSSGSVKSSGGYKKSSGYKKG